MKPDKLQPIECGYGDDKFIFHLRMISLAESDAIDARLAEILPKDADRYDRQFQILRDVLGQFSCDAPQRVVMKNGEAVTVPLVEKAGTPAEAINTAFAERTARSERVVRTVYNVFFSQLTPDYRFLSLAGS